MQATSRGSHGVHSRAQSASRPVRWRVASACPNVTQRGASDRHNSACPSKRRPAATLRVAKKGASLSSHVTHSGSGLLPDRWTDTNLS